MVNDQVFVCGEGNDLYQAAGGGGNPGLIRMDSPSAAAEAETAHIVYARVAGFDTAIHGLPETAHPLLFEAPGGNVLVATTKTAAGSAHSITGGGNIGRVTPTMAGAPDPSNPAGPAAGSTLCWPCGKCARHCGNSQDEARRRSF